MHCGLLFFREAGNCTDTAHAHVVARWSPPRTVGGCCSWSPCGTIGAISYESEDCVLETIRGNKKKKISTVDRITFQCAIDSQGWRDQLKYDSSCVRSCEYVMISIQL